MTEKNQRCNRSLLLQGLVLFVIMTAITVIMVVTIPPAKAAQSGLNAPVSEQISGPLHKGENP